MKMGSNYAPTIHIQVRKHQNTQMTGGGEGLKSEKEKHFCVVYRKKLRNVGTSKYCGYTAKITK